MARRLRSVGSPSLDIHVESFATCGVTFSHPALAVAHPSMARRLRSVGAPSLDVHVESFATCGVTFSHPALGVAHPWRDVYAP
ncbi:MAG: hypothetical protein DHS20C11_09540 [Lysobacteraceae bacterium]|nr:MAG: hypothetical protein DHS20C11_09540 [Xanthomonadaceae bacterium]